MEIAQLTIANQIGTAAGIRHHTAKAACCQLTSYDILATLLCRVQFPVLRIRHKGRVKYG
jgi:hypothetical protein